MLTFKLRPRDSRNTTLIYVMAYDDKFAFYGSRDEHALVCLHSMHRGVGYYINQRSLTSFRNLRFLSFEIKCAREDTAPGDKREMCLLVTYDADSISFR